MPYLQNKHVDHGKRPWPKGLRSHSHCQKIWHKFIGHAGTRWSNIIYKHRNQELTRGMQNTDGASHTCVTCGSLPTIMKNGRWYRSSQQGGQGLEKWFVVFAYSLYVSEEEALRLTWWRSKHGSMEWCRLTWVGSCTPSLLGIDQLQTGNHITAIRTALSPN